MIELKPPYDKVFDAQEHFRVLLDAMAHPGKLFPFSEVEMVGIPGIPHGIFYIAFALLNADVHFTFLGPESENAKTYITQNTSSLVSSLEMVDFVFFPGNLDGEFFRECKNGNLSYPEEGASLVAYVDTLSTQKLDKSLELSLKGPGVESINTVYIQGLDIKSLEILKDINSEFPLGLDLYVVDQNSTVMAIPRSNHLQFNTI